MNNIERMSFYKSDDLRGSAKISLEQSKTGGLFVKLETQRLLIRSVFLSDLENYHTKLYGDPAVMGQVSYGVTKSLEKVRDRMERVWLKRWESNFPFSALAVLDKVTGAFIGHVMLRDCKLPGVTEIHYLICKEKQKQGYGMEAASAVIYELLPRLIKDSFLMHGKPVDTIMGTAKFNNFGSVKILETLLKHDKDEEKYGAIRKFYSLNTSQLRWHQRTPDGLDVAYEWAGVQEKQTLRDLFMTSFTENYRALNLKPEELATDDIAGVLADFWDNDEVKSHLDQNVLWLVAKHKTEIVGYASFHVKDAPQEITLKLLCIKPEMQRKGIGKQLLNSILTRVLSDKIVLVTRRVNRTAIDFYKKQGFQECSSVEKQANIDSKLCIQLERGNDV